jgi:tRNA A-37 threonylcarbamoyl transferase component Bud32
VDDADLSHSLRGLIGKGPRGTVWRAERRGAPGRVEAVKLIDLGPSWSDTGATAGGHVPSARLVARELERMATALRGLAHPQVLPVERIQVRDGMIAIVMPYAAGGSLGDVLAARAGEGLPATDVASLGADLFAALAAIHAAGLSHGGISLGNVLFRGDGRVQLADAGLAGALRPLEATDGGTSEDDRHEDVLALARLLLGVMRHDGTTAAAGLRQVLGHVSGHDVAVSPLAGPRGDRRRSTTLVDSSDPAADAASLAARLDALRRAPPAHGDTGDGEAHRGTGDAPVVVPSDPSPDRAAPPHDPLARPEPPLRAPPRRQRPAHPRRAGRRAVTRALTDLRRGDRRRPPWRGILVSLLIVAATLAGSSPTGEAPTPRSIEPDAGAGETPGIERPPSDAVPTTTQPRRTPRTVPPLCAGLQPPPDDLGPGQALQVVHADLDGRGCGVPLGFDGRHLVVTDPSGGAERFVLDGISRGAALLAGDWNCDGREGIAFYLPASGELLRFDRLPEVGGELRARTQPVGVRGGTASVRVEDRGCAEIVVDPT